MTVRLWSKMPCAQCGELRGLEWQTVTKNGLIVHGVPVYVCQPCDSEWLELQSACVYDQQVQAAYDCGLTEITLFYGDVTVQEPQVS